MKEHNCIEELGQRLAIREPSEFRSIVFNLGSDEALRINSDLSVTLNPNVQHDDIVKAVFESVSRLIQKQIEDEVQKRLKERMTKSEDENRRKAIEAEKQRDALIKALEEIKKKIHGYTDKHICEIATNAITKAKG